MLINCASVILQAYLYNNNYDEWEQGINVNINGVLYSICAVLPIIHIQEYGQIINSSSIGVHAISQIPKPPASTVMPCSNAVCMS